MSAGSLDGALAGKVALVTGASRGIGKGCALELGAAGATVYVTGRTLEEGSAPLPGTIATTAQEVTVLGGHGIAVRCDHRNDDDVEALFARVEAEQGRLDVLVNNAFKIPPELTSGRPFWKLPISSDGHTARMSRAARKMGRRIATEASSTISETSTVLTAPRHLISRRH